MKQEYYLNQSLDNECFRLPEKDKKYLLKNNYLGEYYTDKEKAKVRSNLGIDPKLELVKRIIDNYVDENSQSARYLLFDNEPTEGNYSHILSSDSLYNIFQKYYTAEELDEKLSNFQPSDGNNQPSPSGENDQTTPTNPTNPTNIDDQLDLNSTNPVQNKVIKAALNDVIGRFTPDDQLSDESEKPVQNKVLKGIIDEINERLGGLQPSPGGNDQPSPTDGQTPITVDNQLSNQSENPVQNKVIKTALDEINNRLDELQPSPGGNDQTPITVDDYLSTESQNPVQNKVIANKVNNIENRISQIQIDGGSGTSIISITWQELRDQRDNGQLIPGQQYRIIDYVTTVGNLNVAYEEARSAGHQFDIIVVADSDNTINETARAALHQGDTYFVDNNLEGWKLKYCLDNNIDRYRWADTINGRGIIYEMEDEFGNIASYDFKNIQFKLYKVQDTLSRDEINGKYVGLNQYKIYPNQSDLGFSFLGRSITIDEDDYAWCYTFSSNSSQKEQEDSSLNKSGASVRNNILNNPTKVLSFSVIFNNSKAVITNKLFLCGAVISGSVYFNNISVWRSIICGQTRANNIDEIVQCCITSHFIENTILGLYYSEILGEFNENLCMTIQSCIIEDKFTLNRICQMIYCKVGEYFTRNETEAQIICCSFSNHVERNNFRGPIKFLEIKKDYFSGNIIESVQYLTIDSNQTTSSEARLQGIKVCAFCNHSENVTEKLLVQTDNPDITGAEVSILRFSQDNFPPKGINESYRKTIFHNTISDTFLTEYKSSDSQTIMI